MVLVGRGIVVRWLGAVMAVGQAAGDQVGFGKGRPGANAHAAQRQVALRWIDTDGVDAVRRGAVRVGRAQMAGANGIAARSLIN